MTDPAKAVCDFKDRTNARLQALIEGEAPLKARIAELEAENARLLKGAREAVGALLSAIKMGFPAQQPDPSPTKD